MASKNSLAIKILGKLFIFVNFSPFDIFKFNIFFCFLINFELFSNIIMLQLFKKDGILKTFNHFHHLTITCTQFN